MNGVEKAIDWFLRRKQNITICDKCSEMEEIALEALQEKAERENPQPLKPEQLKELVNCPYWHKSLIGNGDKWAILPAYTAQNPEDYHYGEYWFAYRYKPKEAV